MIMKPDKISVGLHGLKSNISKLAIGLDGLNFSRRIASKYGIFRKSDSMPALIFRRLFGIRTANNSLHGGQLNNYTILQKFNYLINPLQKTSGFFSNSVRLIHDIRACTKIQMPMRCYGKTDARPDNQNRSIQTFASAKKTDKASTNINAATPGADTPSTRKTGTVARYENNVTEQAGEGQKQFRSVLYQHPLCTRNILTSVNPVKLSYLQRTFNFEFAGSKPGQIVASAKKTGKASTNINAATPGADTPSTRKTGTVAQYENNITEQAGEGQKQFISVHHQHLPGLRTWFLSQEGQKQFISVFHKPPLYTRNILTSINPITLSYLQRTFNFEASTNMNAATQGADARSAPSVNPVIPDNQYMKNIETVRSKPDRMISAAKTMEIPLSRKSGPSQGTDIPLLRQTRTLNDDENIAPKQIGEEKKQFIQELHRASVSSKTILTSANPATLGYLHRNNIETAGSKMDRKIPVAGTMEIPSAGKSGATRVIETPSIQQTRTLKDDKNIAPEQSRKGKKQFIPVLHKLPLYTRNILTSVINPVTLSYLQRTFNFEASTDINAATQDADASSYQQIRNIQDLQYENVFNHDTKPGRGDLVPSFHNIMTLKGSINPSNNNVFQTPLINLKRVDHIMKNSKSQEVNENIVYNSRELILKKPAHQKTEIVPENKEGIQTEKVSSTGMRDNLIKELVKEKPIHEIGLIADRVYKIIERRISIEKDRRGLF